MFKNIVPTARERTRLRIIRSAQRLFNRHGFEAMLEMFERGQAPDDPASRDRALAIGALCVGGMAVARSLADPRLARDLRQAAMALSLGDPSRAMPRRRRRVK